MFSYGGAENSWLLSCMFGLDLTGFSSPVGYSGFFLVKFEFGGIVLSVYLV